MIPVLVAHRIASIPFGETVYACVLDSDPVIESVRAFSHDKKGIDELIASVHMARGNEAVYIARTDILHPSAQQSLLKFLEEPPVELPVVLTAERIDRVPDTIRSRCFVKRDFDSYDSDAPIHMRLDAKERLHDTSVSAYNVPGIDDYRIVEIDLEKEI